MIIIIMSRRHFVLLDESCMSFRECTGGVRFEEWSRIQVSMISCLCLSSLKISDSKNKNLFYISNSSKEFNL